MYDIELALQPASEEVAPDACTPAKKTEQEKTRAKNLARTLDDDAVHRTTAQLEEPPPSDTKVDDNNVAEKLGYSHWMITSVWDAGQHRLLKANVKSKHQEQRSRIDHIIKVNKVWLEERALLDRIFVSKIKL